MFTFPKPVYRVKYKVITITIIRLGALWYHCRHFILTGCPVNSIGAIVNFFLV